MMEGPRQKPSYTACAMNHLTNPCVPRPVPQLPRSPESAATRCCACMRKLMGKAALAGTIKSQTHIRPRLWRRPQSPRRQLRRPLLQGLQRRLHFLTAGAPPGQNIEAGLQTGAVALKLMLQWGLCSVTTGNAGCALERGQTPIIQCTRSESTDKNVRASAQAALFTWPEMQCSALLRMHAKAHAMVGRRTHRLAGTVKIRTAPTRSPMVPLAGPTLAAPAAAGPAAAPAALPPRRGSTLTT